MNNRIIIAVVIMSCLLCPNYGFAFGGAGGGIGAGGGFDSSLGAKNLETNISELQDLKDELNKEIYDKKKILDAIEAHKTKLEQSYNKIEKDYNKLSSKNRLLKAENKKLAQLKKDIEHQNQKLKASAEEMRHEKIRLGQQVNNLQTKSLKYQQKNRDIQARFEQNEQDFKKLEQEKEEIEKHKNYFAYGLFGSAGAILVPFVFIFFRRKTWVLENELLRLKIKQLKSDIPKTEDQENVNRPF